MQNVESSATRKTQGILVLSWLTGQVETRVQTELAALAVLSIRKNVFFRPFFIVICSKKLS